MTMKIIISPVVELMAKMAGISQESIQAMIEEKLFYSFNEICASELTPENPVVVLAEAPEGVVGFCWTEHQKDAYRHLRGRYGQGVMYRLPYPYAKTRHCIFEYRRATDERA